MVFRANGVGYKIRGFRFDLGVWISGRVEGVGSVGTCCGLGNIVRKTAPKFQRSCMNRNVCK